MTTFEISDRFRSLSHSLSLSLSTSLSTSLYLYLSANIRNALCISTIKFWFSATESCVVFRFLSLYMLLISKVRWPFHRILHSLMKHSIISITPYFSAAQHGHASNAVDFSLVTGCAVWNKNRNGRGSMIGRWSRHKFPIDEVSYCNNCPTPERIQ